MAARAGDFRKLRRYANRLGVKVQTLDEKTFDRKYAGTQAFYQPTWSRICLNRCLKKKTEQFQLYVLAHEIGHAVDHMSDPAGAEEYALHYDLASLYSEHGLELLGRSREVFQDREDIAYSIGESILRELGIAIDNETRSEFNC